MDRFGRLLAALRAVLLASAGAAAGHVAAGGAGEAVAQQSDRDEADWLAARADGSRRAFERYLQLHPLGRHAGEAFTIIARMSVETGWTPVPGEPILDGSSGRGGAETVRVTDVY
jgi:hypothetical protein